VPVLPTLTVKVGRLNPTLARELVDALAERFVCHAVHVVADAGLRLRRAFVGLGHDMATRARLTAVFYQLTPS